MMAIPIGAVSNTSRKRASVSARLRRTWSVTSIVAPIRLVWGPAASRSPRASSHRSSPSLTRLIRYRTWNGAPVVAHPRIAASSLARSSGWTQSLAAAKSPRSWPYRSKKLSDHTAVLVSRSSSQEPTRPIDSAASRRRRSWARSWACVWRSVMSRVTLVNPAGWWSSSKMAVMTTLPQKRVPSFRSRQPSASTLPFAVAATSSAAGIPALMSSGG